MLLLMGCWLLSPVCVHLLLNILLLANHGGVTGGRRCQTIIRVLVVLDKASILVHIGRDLLQLWVVVRLSWRCLYGGEMLRVVRLMIVHHVVRVVLLGHPRQRLTLG